MRLDGAARREHTAFRGTLDFSHRVENLLASSSRRTRMVLVSAGAGCAGADLPPSWLRSSLHTPPESGVFPPGNSIEAMR